MNQIELLQHLSKSMKEAGVSPRRVQLAQVGAFYHASAFNEVPEELISEYATCGFSRDRDVAVTKALVEWAERSVGRYALEKGIEVCQTKRSDGLAAFPVQVPDFISKARENALNEAIERYVWATWWDDETIGHQRSSLQDYEDGSGRILDILEICDQLNCPEIEVVVPLHNASDREVIILIAYSKDGGVFSGGACGSAKNTLETIDRAFAELYRHILATEKFKKKPAPVNSFYENRLLYFGLGEGLQKVKKRLSCDGTKSVELPDLKFDVQVPSLIDKMIYVHRCYFLNQPPFVDGALERLCL